MLNVRDILLATDGSRCAASAETHAAQLAVHLQARLHILHVRDGQRESDDAWQWDDGQPLGNARRTVVESPSPADAILQYAVENNVDLVTLGARGNDGSRKPALGAVAADVVRRAHCSVLIVPEHHPFRHPRRIAAPVDFSAHASESSRLAAALAREWNARLELVHVVVPQRGEPAYTVYPSPQPVPQVAERWERQLERFVTALPREVATARHVRVGPPAPTIVNFALERQPDLVVIGARGASSSGVVGLGSVADTVSRTAFCPVLTVRSRLRASSETSSSDGTRTRHGMKRAALAA